MSQSDFPFVVLHEAASKSKKVFAGSSTSGFVFGIESATRFQSADEAQQFIDRKGYDGFCSVRRLKTILVKP